jgi:hypothetical protein
MQRIVPKIMAMTTTTKRTWVVVVRGATTSVFERETRDGALIRVRDFAAMRPKQSALHEVAHWLDVARRARAFERFVLVALESEATELLSGLSRPTRALLAKTSSEAERSLRVEAAP